LGNLIKVIELIYKILEIAKAFDASFEKTPDGKIKICLILDPKEIVKQHPYPKE
jgi:hypothetical protein